MEPKSLELSHPLLPPKPCCSSVQRNRAAAGWCTCLEVPFQLSLQSMPTQMFSSSTEITHPCLPSHDPILAATKETSFHSIGMVGQGCFPAWPGRRVWGRGCVCRASKEKHNMAAQKETEMRQSKYLSVFSFKIPPCPLFHPTYEAA